MPGRTIVPNIGPGERRRRLRIGAAATVAAAVLLGALLALDASRWWRLFLALPLWIGALGILQSRGGT